MPSEALAGLLTLLQVTTQRKLGVLDAIGFVDFSLALLRLLRDLSLSSVKGFLPRMFIYVPYYLNKLCVPVRLSIQRDCPDMFFTRPLAGKTAFGQG